ncbi:serine hydrolase domain-containing protein [Actinosynnema sp. NPDC047251]|nr:serine hydrolase domain-containing protein [Saccharothrix espanaensis]
MRRLLQLFVVVSLLAGCAAPEPDDLTQQERQMPERFNEFHQRLKQEGFSGVAEIRWRKEKHLSEAYGEADPATKRPNTLDTRFPIGEATQMFTAVAVVLLARKGELKLSDPVCSRLPVCVPGWQPITVEQLLLHTSGLPDYTEQALSTIGPSHLDLVRHVQSLPLVRAPGSWQPGNSGYAVLGALIEHVTGERYGQHLKRVLFDPLGMAATAADWDTVDPAQRAVGSPASTPARYADRAIVSTGPDLVRWGEFLVSGDTDVTDITGFDLLGKKNVSKMTTDATGNGQGYGLRTTGESVFTTIWQTGAVAGFSVYFGVSSSDQAIVAVLGNRPSPDTADLGRTIMTTITK